MAARDVGTSPSGTVGADDLRLVFWELTARCNLRCQHCRAEAQAEFAEGELTTAEILRVAQEIRESSDPLVVLTGGEPLARPDVFEIATACTRLFTRVALATNGTLIDEQVAQRLAESGVKRVSVSLDGATAQTHDTFRGQPGCFDAARRGLAALGRVGLSRQINMTVTRHNLHELPALLDFAQASGIAAFHLFMLVPVGCGAEISAGQRLTPAQFEETLRWLAARSQELRDRIQIKATCAPQYYRIVRQMAQAAGEAGDAAESNATKFVGAVPSRPGVPLPGPSRSGVPLPDPGREPPSRPVLGPPVRPLSGRAPHGLNSFTRGCLAGSSVCFISRTGAVQPCGYLPVVVGNVRQTPLGRIWRDSAVFAALRDPRQLKGKCGACGYRTLCQGCRARAFAMTGDFLAEEPDCSYVPERQKKLQTASPGDPALTRRDREVLARIQGEFPLAPDPYAELGGDLGCSPEDVWRSVAGLRQSGIIRRIGGSFAAGPLGYISTLVAARVDPDRIAEAAAVASAFPEVTHNYERDAAFNLWFTVIAADRGRLEAILAAVRQAAGVRDLHELPALRQVKIRVEFAFSDGDSAPAQAPATAPTGSGVCLALDATDRRAICLACGDLGSDRQPFRAWAEALGITAADLLARLAAYQRAGAMRRFGAVLRHHAAGFSANGMSVWDVPAAESATLCERLAACPEVSHCYERPRFPGWPYNVFAMIHGHRREECLALARSVADSTGVKNYAVLFSVREFKKTSMVYFAEAATGG